ncbi:MAG: DNA repair protein RecO [Acutalibacteraceae bacterium]
MFPELRTDIVLLSLASYFAQLAEVLSQEDAASPALLPLILNALPTRSRSSRSRRAARQGGDGTTACRPCGLSAGAFRLLCGGNPEPDRFSIADGTLECASCRASDGVRMPLSAASLAAMRYIVSCPDKKLFSFALTGAAEKELCDAAESYLLTQLERSFYTLDFYKSLLTE